MPRQVGERKPQARVEFSDQVVAAFDRAGRAVNAGRLDDARSALAQAVEGAPDSRILHHARTWVEDAASRDRHDVYTTPDGFRAFIRGGGNAMLYRRLSAKLVKIIEGSCPRTLLDIGVGDGEALVPALRDARQRVRVDLVEPSRALLGEAVDRLRALGVQPRTYAESLETFVRRPATSWDLVQATFSLHTIAPAERPPLLAWMHRHARRLLIAEFDERVADAATAPIDPKRELAWSRSLLERYEQGLREYSGDEQDRVAAGFLVPVLIGNFSRDQRRQTYEQPIETWEEDLRLAGFSRVSRHLLSHYWWADAYLLEATP